MSAAIATLPWPAPSRTFGDFDVCAGRRGGRASDASTHAWVLRRNCTVSPGPMMAACLLLWALSIAVAVPLTWRGASVAIAFAGTEVVAVGLALWVYARHVRIGRSVRPQLRARLAQELRHAPR